MYKMFKSENIVVTNGTTRYKLKQGNKKVLFNSITLIGFTRVSSIFMRNKELHYLLYSRRTNSLNILLFVVFIILIMQYYVALTTVNFIKFTK